MTAGPHTYVRAGTGVTAVWAASTVYALNAKIQPNPANGFWYQATSVSGTGTSGSTQPNFPTTVGGTVTDNPGGNQIVWTNEGTAFATGSQLTAAELAQMDASLASLVNGVDGGCWSPSSQIVISGSGLQLTGPFFASRGGSLTAANAGGFACQDGDYPLLGPTHTGRNRTIVYECITGEGFPMRPAWRARWKDCGMQSIAQSIDQSDGNGPQTTRLWVPIRCHTGATLSSAILRFRVGFTHTQMPTQGPSARVLRIDASGNIVTLSSSATGADANGYFYATLPGTVGLWTGNQTISLTCDQNNVVDISQYTYYVEIVEEQGLTGYPWALVFKQPVKLAANLTQPTFASYWPFGLTSMSGGDVQTGAYADGDRILLINQVTQTFDGIWIAHAGAWARATDFQAASDFSQGMVVPVDQGGQCGSTYWQASSTTASWDPGTQPFGTFPFDSGNAYAVTNVIIPTKANGFWYECTTATGTNSVEPAWPPIVGATVTDAGGNVWTCKGPATTPVAFVCIGPDDDETAQTAGAEFFAHGNIFDQVDVSFTNITSRAFQ